MTQLPGSLVWSRADDVSRYSRYGGNALPSELIALEPRVMLDGAAMVAAVAEAEPAPAEDSNDQADAPVDAQPAADAEADTDKASAEAPSVTVVIIDAAVQDAETLLTGIDPSAEVYFLGPGTDGVQQITSILSNHDNVAELHIISHGTIGGISLGSSALNSGNAESYAADFVQWDAALSDGADILLYGCNVGQDGAGQDFINLVAELTSADVAASSDLTGAAEQGGDWDLEAATGTIEASIAVDDTARQAYQNVLDTSLNPGDIVVIQAGGTNDSYSLLLLEDLSAGSTFFITDRGWNENTNSFVTVAAFNSEDTDQITLTADLTAGTVISSDGGGGYTVTDNIDPLVGTSMNFNTFGDSLIIYETDTNLFDGTPTLLYGFNNAGGSQGFALDPVNLGWAALSETPGANNAGQPISHFANGELTNVNVAGADGTSFGLLGITALAEPDNVRVNFGAVVNMTPEELRMFIHDPANWTITNGSSTDFSGTTFTISSNQAPSIANLNADAVNYAEGDAPTLIDLGSNATVTDADSTNFDGGNLTVTIAAGEDATEDVLSVDTSGTVSLGGTIAGSIVSVGGIAVGTLGNTIAAGNDFVVNFNTANATPARVQSLVRALTYQNLDGTDPTEGARTVRVTVTDETAETSTNNDVIVTVAAVNDAPTVTAPGAALNATEQVGLNIHGAGFTAAEVDEAGGQATATLAVGEGTIAVAAGNSGVTITGGNNSATVTLTGTIAQINNLLTGGGTGTIVYTNALDAPAANTIFSVTVNDQGNTGTDPGLTGTPTTEQGSANQTINIAAVNDAPIVTAPGAALNATEQIGLNIHGAGFTAAEVDEAGGQATATLNVGEGAIAVAVGNSGVTITGGNNSATVTLTGTIAQINNLLTGGSTGTIVYTNALDAPAANTIFSVTVNDQGNTGTDPGLTGTPTTEQGSANQTINIAAVNDAPIVTAPGAALNATEQIGLDIHGAGFTAAEVDEASGQATATLNVGEGGIAVAVGNSGVTITGGNNSGTVTLTGTITQINNLLTGVGTGTIVYTNANDAPSANTTFTVTVTDQGNTGTDPGLTGTGTTEEGSANQTINIAAVNDAPTVTAPGAALNATEQVGLNIHGAGFTATEVDEAGGQATATLNVGEGAIAVAVGNSGVTITGGNNSTTVTLTGTIAQINNLLTGGGTGTIVYTNASDTPSANTTFTVTVNDQGNTGTDPGLTGTATTEQGSANQTITIIPVNDAPLIANLAGDTATVLAGGAAANIDVGGDAVVTDPDGALNFNNGFVIFDITAGTDNGSFSFDGTNVTSGGNATINNGEIIVVGGDMIGSVIQDGQGGNALLIAFSATATPTALSTLIQNLLYAAPSGFGDRTLTTTIDDGDGTANGGDADTVIVSTINVPVAPQVQSIVRQDPAAADTNADAVTFRVTFDSDVVNVDTADFALSGTLAGAGNITGVNQISNSVYDVTVDVPDAGNGTINLDISATPTVQNGGGINLQNAAVPIGADETYTIDNIPPGVPSIDLTAASDTNINNDDITTDTTPTFTGIAEAGSTITLTSSIDGQFVQGTAADYGGAGLTPLLANALSQGVHTITVTSTDAAGNASEANLTVTIDTTAPVLNAFTLNTPANAQTNADTLVFEATFDETVNGVDAADFSVNGATTATVTNVAQTSPTTFLVTVSGGDLANFDGTVNLNIAAGALITDVAGNALIIAEPGTDETYILDNTAPNPPAGLDLQALSDTGISNTDDLTADTTPTIAGTAEANATITLTSDRDGVVGVTTANAAGVWTITTIALSEGVHSLTATATDTTGNISAASAPLAITIDVTANAPSAPDLVATSDTGPSDTDNETTDTTPTLSGTAEAGSTITLTSSISGVVGTVVADTAGEWSITTPSLPEGVHVFTAIMTDRAGNVSPASTPTTVTISTGGQASTGTDGSDIGGLGSSNNGVSNDRFDAASGEGSDTDGSGTTFGTETSSGAGPQNVQGGAGPLAPGRVGVDDIITAGIGGSNPFPGTGISDSDLPGTIVLHPSSDTGFSNSDATTRDNTPTFTGEAPANTVVTITSSIGGILGTANVDENGQWTFTSPSLVDGIHELIATPKDENGNEGTPSLPLLATIDTVAPPVPSAPEFIGDIDQLRSDDTPTFKGKAEPGARIVLTSDQDGIVGQIIADENGNWQVTTDPLSENAHKLSVTATDPAGNASDLSPVLDLIVRAEEDTALNFDRAFPVEVDIARADGSIAFDVTALLSGFSADIVSTEIHGQQHLAREPSNALGFTRQLQTAGNNRSLQVYL